MQKLAAGHGPNMWGFGFQGRTLDLATCLVSASGVLLIVSPTQTVSLTQRLQKFILFGDEVRLTPDTCAEPAIASCKLGPKIVFCCVGGIACVKRPPIFSRGRDGVPSSGLDVLQP